MTNQTTFKRTLKTATLTAIMGAAILGLASHPASAFPSSGTAHIVLADATPLSLSEMENLRGGFADPSGLIYQFAVDVKTLLNGSEVFSRSIVVAPSNGQLQATTASNLAPNNSAGGLSISMLGNGAGIIVTDANGNSTTALSQTANGTPASIILNTGSGRNLTQSVNISLTLQNMTSIMNFLHTATQGAAMAQHSSIRALGF